MKRTVVAVCLRDQGVCVETRELPEPQPHQIVVKPLAAPINPADLNVIEGTYPVRPDLPAVLGNEGVGEIVERGGAVTDMAVGQWVIAPARPGWWCTARVLDAADAVVVPAGLPCELAALLGVNPPTAWRMLADFESLQPGDWVIQNAANSAAGRSVIQIARHRKLRTVNIVRRAELAAELQAIGADVVVTEGSPIPNPGAARLGLNAVGGDSARLIARALAPHGTLVTYGAMARQPLRVDNGVLIFRDIRFRGFWITDWFQHAPRRQIDEMFASIFALAQTGALRIPVEKTYPLAQATEALAEARREGRSGKILFVAGS